MKQSMRQGASVIVLRPLIRLPAAPSPLQIHPHCQRQLPTPLHHPHQPHLNHRDNQCHQIPHPLLYRTLEPWLSPGTCEYGDQICTSPRWHSLHIFRRPVLNSQTLSHRISRDHMVWLLNLLLKEGKSTNPPALCRLSLPQIKHHTTRKRKHLWLFSTKGQQFQSLDTSHMNFRDQNLQE